MESLLNLPNFDASDIDEAIKRFKHLNADDKVVIFTATESVGHADELKKVSNTIAEATIDMVEPDDDAAFCKLMYAICIFCGMLIYKNKEANAQDSHGNV